MPSLAVLPESTPTDMSENSIADEIVEPGELNSLLAELHAIVPPVWPLRDYVAVNPFLGLADRPFLNARQLLCEVRDCDLLPTDGYFRALVQRGEITPPDLRAAVQQCVGEYPLWFGDMSAEQLARDLVQDQAESSTTERRFFTLAEVVDRQDGTNWLSHIVNDITRHCSAHFDEGQAAWPNPWKELSLYQAWHASARLSHRMDMLGIKGFHHLIMQMPTQPREAVAWLLEQFAIPRRLRARFLLSELFSVAGWASFVRYRVREAEMVGRQDDDLVGLLAIRLAYDLALARVQGDLKTLTDVALTASTENVAAKSADVSDEFSWNALDDAQADGKASSRLSPPRSVLTRYAFQVAAEIANRRKLEQQLLSASRSVSHASERKLAQLVFCIDVRSEVMRRHLESLSGAIETFGFAGFFGMALEYVPLGDVHGPAQCPVLLRPGFQIQETVGGVDTSWRERAIKARRERRVGRKVWKSFQSSAVSCFSFVETIGLSYVGNLLSDTFRWTRPVNGADRDGLPNVAKAVLVPDVCEHESQGFTLTRMTDLAEGMLRNLGLTEGFARIVAVCGHACEVVNNPYRAGLDCGACGGHSGEPNARVASALLNDPRVRSNLKERGIEIPDDTWFVPGVHNTTTDEIRLLDTESLPATHQDEMAQLRSWLAEAGRLCRAERSTRLRGSTAETLLQRSRDWSEVRPEWGLAGNAAFIVAPRSRTAGLNLGGRTFLHSYDQKRDPELKVLELIMTAPMVVTSWINLQYFASSVDNRSFGSGNKVIHNVVGQLGVLSGNGGDLMTGLPWQSVHDGERLQHAPLRLSVIIEASRESVQRIIAKHSSVRDLVSNGWLSLIVLEDKSCYRWTSTGEWQVEDLS